MANANSFFKNAKWLSGGLTLAPGGVGSAVRFYATSWPAAATYTSATQTWEADANGAMGNVDGTAPAVGDRVLYAAGASSDGLFVITSLGGASSKFTLVRASDFVSTDDYLNANGVTFAVYAGSANIGKVITMSVASNFVLDTSTPTFTASSSAVSYANVVTALNAAAGASAIDMSASTGTMKPQSGLWTWQGKQAATATANSITDPGNAGAIPVTSDGVCNITTAGAETRTLAIPTFVGQRLTICMNVDGGDGVITVASAFNQAGNTIITLNDAGDTVDLVGALIGGTRRWRLVSNDGATLS